MLYKLSLFTNFKEVITLNIQSLYDLTNDNKHILKDYLLKYLVIQTIWNHLETYKLIAPFIEMINFNIYISLYWLFLGILSSIGLGCGINTGLLFLFPFITKITLTSLSCGHTNFEIYNDKAFECNKTDNSPNIYFIFLKTLHPAILWGIGTALGELPPYYFARKSKLSNNLSEYSRYFNNNSIMCKINHFMINFIKKHGFYTILFFASWPNMLFDACGMACGFCLISLKEFLLPTVIGKGFIKSPLQSLFLIYMIIQTVNDQYLSFMPDILVNYIKTLTYNEKLNNSTYLNTNKTESKSPELISMIIFYLWNFLIFLLVGYFMKETLEDIANKKKEKKSK